MPCYMQHRSSALLIEKPNSITLEINVKPQCWFSDRPDGTKRTVNPTTRKRGQRGGPNPRDSPPTNLPSPFVFLFLPSLDMNLAWEAPASFGSRGAAAGERHRCSPRRGSLAGGDAAAWRLGGAASFGPQGERGARRGAAARRLEVRQASGSRRRRREGPPPGSRLRRQAPRVPAPFFSFFFKFFT